MIDASAKISSTAEIASDAVIGPWVTVGDGVRIGARTRIDSHCVILGPTSLGEDNHIFPFCSIGDKPQDKKFSADGASRLEIGNGNTIREYCSINRGTPAGGGLTQIGDDNWIMS